MLKNVSEHACEEATNVGEWNALKVCFYSFGDGVSGIRRWKGVNKYKNAFIKTGKKKTAGMVSRRFFVVGGDGGREPGGS